MSTELTAYIVGATKNWQLLPASATREWMDNTPQRFAYRCLPLAIANQAGWVATCPLSFSATWDGGTDLKSMKLEFLTPEGDNVGQIRSHFGSGILTFSLPWIFRTSPGWGLVVRGPTNYPKDGCVALDGIVETDWAPYSFTMNWKLMRRKEKVFFRQGEPICMIQPVRLADLESVVTRQVRIEENPALSKAFSEFSMARQSGLDRLFDKGEKMWAKDYMRGQNPDGSQMQGHEHRTRLQLPGFDGQMPPT
jgi:hypothetical protein